MITPNDIATKDFKKVAMGYSPEEVDIFLDDIYEDYERLYIDSQKEKPAPAPTSEVTPDKFGALENMIERTLLLAETAAAETKTAARTEAEHIVNGAKVEAEAILQEARMKAYAIEEEINSLQSRYELMKARVKLMLYTEIELLDQNEIVAEKEEAHQNNQ